MTESSGKWMTAAALDKLRAEYDHLTTTGRDEVVKRIAEARAHGDLKENSEYDTAKNDQGLMEARIRELQHLIENAVVGEVTDSGIVEIGTVATVVDDDGDELEFFVAHAENRIDGMMLASPDSPLGSALLGAKPGDDVTFEAPGGTFTYQVTNVRVYEG
ncbi:MAG: transcription elongation factor GreA [Acidimicrobiia bacterium]|nr:transcription elongation factor GreA [Acidimicrobiia bacterium]